MLSCYTAIGARIYLVSSAKFVEIETGRDRESECPAGGAKRAVHGENVMISVKTWSRIFARSCVCMTRDGLMCPLELQSRCESCALQSRIQHHTDHDDQESTCLSLHIQQHARSG
jgi:hypothetical protein